MTQFSISQKCAGRQQPEVEGARECTHVLKVTLEVGAKVGVMCRLGCCVRIRLNRRRTVDRLWGFPRFSWVSDRLVVVGAFVGTQHDISITSEKSMDALFAPTGSPRSGNLISIAKSRFPEAKTTKAPFGALL